ncbi:hypothetical protein ACGVWS_05635 [Enterobacteriaceae bacterium LUAb1]
MKMIITLSSIILFISYPAFAVVTPESCLDINRSVGVSMTDAMIKDFGLQEKDIVIDKTTMTLLEKIKVTEEMAAFYASQSYRSEPKHFFPESEYQSIYLQSNATNIIVKYDYVNKENKHNITLASLIVNDDECSVRFNGYLIVKREF